MTLSWKARFVAKCIVTGVFLLGTYTLGAQQNKWKGKFEQLGQMLPTPNEFRASDGAPGPKYWQQKADYKIKVRLDDGTQKVTGSQSVEYHNNSPQTLHYIWIQLDQNIRDKNSDKTLTGTLKGFEKGNWNTRFLRLNLNEVSTEGGMHLTSVVDRSKQDLPFVINKTMMRIDLPTPLKPGESFEFSMGWWYNINDRSEDYGRSGLEYFPKDKNYLYTIAQFYPRLCVYDDYTGWQNKQFLGTGEFALTFGDYDVEITVPDDHIVAATGELQNPEEVLSKKQLSRFRSAKKSYDKPVVIVDESEAIENEKEGTAKNRTWKFKATNVRDFAFASSRKFIWDAQAVKMGKKDILAMSFYPKEGNPLWEKESTKAVVNTIKTYSKHTIDYPYPVATSVHAADIGMEYPMICFNFGRPNADGTYSDAKKYGMIGVIIHEVGHNYFPMIINSDERQWAWMDEGLNSFLEYRTEQENYTNFPSNRGPANKIVQYMGSGFEGMRPLMVNADQLMMAELGNNAYGKPAAALNILRETIMKPELFDMAFKTYAQRWAFKHPKPADFFRTMEDASGVDLDWFWRGWFYSTDHVDIALDDVKYYRFGDDGPSKKAEVIDSFRQPTFLELNKTEDVYYGEFMNKLDEETLSGRMESKHFYEMSFSNKGGLVMPLLLEIEFEDGTNEAIEIPAEVWRFNENELSKVFYFNKKVASIKLDPNEETADVDVENNIFPRVKGKSDFDSFKDKIKGK